MTADSLRDHSGILQEQTPSRVRAIRSCKKMTRRSFTPAGMNQFKKNSSALIPGIRAATSNVVSGPDLGKVGKTTGHHAFFEMLRILLSGVFKKETIAYAEFSLKL